MTSIDLTIIIVSWNVREALERNLASLLSAADTAVREVIVVDNASFDGTARMIRERFGTVRLIENDWNAGFAHAVNQGLRLAGGRHILLLNPDMLVREGSLDKLVERLDGDASIGVLGARLVSPNGQVVSSVRRDPSLRDQLAIILKLPHVFPNVLARYMAQDMDMSRSQSVDQVRGSFFAFRQKTLDIVGSFDEGYFLWFEEVDFCRRVREANLRVHFAADIEAEDLVGQSFAQVSTCKKQWMFTKSQRRYFKKWHGWGAYFLLLATVPLALVFGALNDMSHGFARKRV